MTPSLRRAVIAEWRGLPSDRPRPDRTQSTAELLPKVMQKLGLKERMQETEILGAWKTLVGEFIAAHSCPIALREGILRPRPPTGAALRAGSRQQTGNPAQVETALWRPGDSRPALPPRLKLLKR